MTKRKWDKAKLDLFSALLVGYEWTTLEDEDPDVAARNIKREISNICIFPTAWRKSKLVLLKKEGKPDGEASSYRPICLTEEITKLYERIINKRITEHLNTQERQLAELQYGFRIGRSTTDAIIAVKERIIAIKQRGNYAMAISIDIKNAFNSIRWNVIESATKELNFPYYLQKIVSEYLCGGEILYQDRNGNTKIRKTFCGVPQGSVLGPTLWNVGFNNIVETKLPGSAEIYAYADDLLLIVEETSLERLIQAVNLDIAIITNNIREIKLEIAPKKTEAMRNLPSSRTSSTLQEGLIDS